MPRNKTDEQVNRDAFYHPYVPAEKNHGTSAGQCTEVGGILAFAYAKDGKLHISADYDTADTEAWATYGPDEAIPTVVSINGETVWTALADGEED